MNRREFVAMLRHQKGGTEAVTINANSEQDARSRLIEMYQDRIEILWIL